MSKLPAQWSMPDGSSTITQTTGELLLETGGHILLETGGDILLEGIIITRKENTSWSSGTTHYATAWAMEDGSSTLSPSNTNVQRTEIDGTVRTLQDGTIRILQETAVTPKAPAVWITL